MGNIRHRLAALTATILIWTTLSGIAALGAPCPTPDHVTRVTGDGECLIVKTVDNGGENEPRTLFVLLHGNHSNGSPAVSMYRVADTVAKQAPKGAIAVALVRPGYNDDAGNRSSGSDVGRADNFTAANIDIIAAAIAELKAFHHAERVYLLGHSGGAAIAGVILGRHPGLADGALLLGCPCDVPMWRRFRSGYWISESPHNYVAAIPKEAKITLIVGENDTTTPPNLSSTYFAQLQAHGQGYAKLLRLADADHLSVLRAPQAIDELLEMAR